MNSRPPLDLLLDRVIHGHRRLRHQVLVVHVGHDTDDAAGAGADADELRDRIRPHHPAVDGLQAREHPARETLADDDDFLAVCAIGVVEVAAGDELHPKRAEEAGRHRAELRARILFSVRLAVILDRELRGEEARIAPGHDRPERHPLDARQRRDPANRFLIEARDVRGLSRVGHDRHVHRQQVAAETGLLALQREERRDQHPGARDQHERGANLHDREHPQPAVRARRQADAAAREAHPVGGLRRRQPRHERQQHRRGDRQAAANPEQARINRDVVRAHREARRVERQHRDHRPGDRHRQHGPGRAEEDALREQRPPQRAGAGAERRANRELAFTPHRPREDQVGDVRARDDEHQARRREQHQQDCPRRRNDLVLQPLGVDAEVGLLLVRTRDAPGPSPRARRAVPHAPSRASRPAPGVRRAPSSGAPARRPSSRRDDAGSSRRWR